MRCQTKCQRAQYKCCTDRSRQRETVKNEQSRSMPSYPTKRSPHQASARFTWQKHRGSLHLLVVDLPVAGLDPTLFASRQQVIEPKHIDVGEEQDESCPDNQQPQASQAQKQILGMANALVEAGLYNAALPELGVVKLKGTQEETDQTQQNNHTSDAC